jgi:hypothetical protein
VICHRSILKACKYRITPDELPYGHDPHTTHHINPMQTH